MNWKPVEVCLRPKCESCDVRCLSPMRICDRFLYKCENCSTPVAWADEWQIYQKRIKQNYPTHNKEGLNQFNPLCGAKQETVKHSTVFFGKVEEQNVPRCEPRNSQCKEHAQKTSCMDYHKSPETADESIPQCTIATIWKSLKAVQPAGSTAPSAFLSIQVIGFDECLARACPYDEGLISICRSTCKRPYDAQMKGWRFHTQQLPALHRKVLNSEKYGMQLPCPSITSALFQPRSFLPAQACDSEVKLGIQRVSSVWGRLFPFQKEAIVAGVKRKGRILLADESGLGKTVQAILIAACIPEAWPLLVICSSYVTTHWKESIKEWMPEDLCPPSPQLWVINCVKDVEDKLRKLSEDGSTAQHVCIISHEHAHRIFSSQMHKYNGLIIDDSQRLQKHKTSSQEFGRHMQRMACLILMNRSPFSNRPIDLFLQIDMLYPGILGGYNEFVDRYSSRLLKKNKPGFGEWPLRNNRVELEFFLSHTVMIRRLRKNFANQLPSKCRIRKYVNIDPRKTAAIDHMEDDVLSLGSQQEGKETVGVPLTQAKINILLNIVGCGKEAPAVYHINRLVSKGSPCKLLAYARQLHVLRRISKDLKRQRIGLVYIDELMSTIDTDKAVRRFQQDSAIKVALISSSMKWASFPFTSASAILFVELMWNACEMINLEYEAQRSCVTGNHLPLHYLCAPCMIDNHLWRCLSSSPSEIVLDTIEYLGTKNAGSYNRVLEF